MVAAIAVMSMIPVGSLAKSVVFMGLALAEIWGFSKLMSKVGNGSTDLLSIAAAMLIFSTALIALGGALAIIGSLNEESLGKSLISIMLAMAGIGVIAAIFSNPTTVAAVYAFSVAFVAIGAAVFLVATGISQLLPLLMLLSTQSASVSEGIQMTLIATFETILGLIPAFVLGAVGALLEFVGLLIVGLAEKVPELLDGFALFLNELADGIRASAGTIGAALGNLASALIEGIVTALYEAGKSLLGGLWDWIVGDSGLDGEALSQQMAVKMGTAGAEGGEALTASMAETLQNQNQEAINAAANGVGDTFTTTLIDNLNNSSGSVSKAADDLGDDAAAAMENRSGASSAAYNTVSGYTSFLQSGNAYGMVSSAFSGLGAWGIQALKNALGIKSPSRVMAEQGMFSVLGLVNGVYDNLDSVEEAGTDTANALLGAMQLAAENADAVLNDGLNPVITPILDLSNLEENSGAISSLLDNGASYNAALAVQAANLAKANQNGAINPLSVNVSFTINQAGKDLTEEDFSRFGNQIANIVNQKLGGMI